MSDLKDQTTTAVSSSVRWPRIAVTAVFVFHGLLFASWTAHIPDSRALRAPQPQAHADCVAAR